MFVEIPKEDVFSKAASSLLQDGDALAIEALKLYYNLNADEKRPLMILFSA